MIVGKGEAAASTLAVVHPDYTARLASWRVLNDAFLGTGGFLDGSYLWPYPRESQDDFTRRQQSARYHNYVETLIDLYTRFIFTQGVKRDSGSTDYNDWTNDVDGSGTTLTELLKLYATKCLLHGHAGCLVDKTADEPVDETRAGERARVVASVFGATAIPDWRFDRKTLTAIKLLEDAPEPSIAEEASTDPADTQQFLLWDSEGWARFNGKGELVSAGVPGLGLVPVVLLRFKPSVISEMLGRPLVGNANVVRALFNRSAEEDQVIRDQAFSVLTVSVGPDGNVDKAKQDLGVVTGTAKALVVAGDIKYATPDQSVPGTIRENIAYLVQELYRAAHVRFRRDSLGSETAEAIRLQYTELNEMLQGFARGLAHAEKQIARAWFAWQHPTPEAAQAAYDAAAPEAQYPEEFFLDVLTSDLEAWAQAIQMDLGPTMTKRIKKRAVRRIDPDIPLDELALIDGEIDSRDTDVLVERLDTGMPTEAPSPAEVTGG
jgi:hypothetical protein